MIPAPPETLPRPPRIVTLQPGTELARVYRPAHGDALAPRAFGPLFRFDHHPLPRGEHPGVGITYAATSLIGALAEAFGDLGLIDKESDRRIARIATRKPLRLIDLVGAAARRLGLDQRIGTTTDYAVTQAWARFLYGGVPDAVGLRWRGRQAGTILIALTDRLEEDALTVAQDVGIGDPAVWPRVVRAAHELSLAMV